MDQKHLSPRHVLLRWVGWFFFINSLIAFLTIFAYLPQLTLLAQPENITTGHSFFTYFYFVVAFYVQVSLFMGVCALLCAIIAALFPRRRLVISCTVVLSALVLCLTVVDALVFRLYHMHYAMIGFKVIKAHALSEVMPLGVKEKIIAAMSLILFFFFEIGVVYFISKASLVRINKVIRVVFVSQLGLWLGVYVFFGLASGESVWSQSYQKVILRTGRITPYLSQVYLSMFGEKNPTKVVDIAGIKSHILTNGLQKPLNYPLASIMLNQTKKHYNVLIIAIDTWRYTSQTALITPQINKFAKKSMQFNNHFSGGNCTGPGIFSMFYSLPPNYWDAFLKNKKSPIIVDSFQRAGYEVRAFLSAQSNFPRFDKTIFVKVKSLKDRTRGGSSLARDKTITNEFISFLQDRDRKKPFFTFMFYDSLHNYCESARPEKNLFKPAVRFCDRFSLNASTNPAPYLNLYNNKAHYVDELVGRVFAALKQQNLMNDTIIIITADHGEQMNDEKMGLWGHASSYSRYQLHVPMLVYWPGKIPTQVNKLTTHYDIVPTLMTRVLACRNKISDYSVGQSLFAPVQPSYFIAGSYGDYAIISGNQALRIYPDGDYSVIDLLGRNKDKPIFNRTALDGALKTLQLFYKP